MILLVYGDRYLYDMHIKKEASKPETPEVNAVYAEEWSDSLYMQRISAPFLEEKKIVVAEMQSLKPGTKNKSLMEYIRRRCLQEREITPCTEICIFTRRSGQAQGHPYVEAAGIPV